MSAIEASFKGFALKAFAFVQPLQGVPTLFILTCFFFPVNRRGRCRVRRVGYWGSKIGINRIQRNIEFLNSRTRCRWVITHYGQGGRGVVAHTISSLADQGLELRSF